MYTGDSAFEAIWRVVARIPRGRVATYGQIAHMAGFSGAARLTGWALGALPDGGTIGGEEVPWHRVINAAGRISRRAGGDRADVLRQLARLRREGVLPKRNGAIDLKRYGWDGRSADAAGPAAGGRMPRRSN